ncbi:MAG: hypothetical protein CL424_19635 [Acidimicrobiaceae bacterium]|nr:hypothetical protein [Acidimicrobiaceae bacterium]
MSTDLDTRIAAALRDAANTVDTAPDAFNAIVERAGTTAAPRRHPWQWAVAASVIALASTAAAFLFTRSDEPDSGPPMIAMGPALGVGTGALVEDCGLVDDRPATAEQASRVAFLPAELPTGYELVEAPSDYSNAVPPTAQVQQRTPSSLECWTASRSFLDPDTGGILTAVIARQGRHIRWDECQLPDGYLPAECVDINGDPSGVLTHEGSRATVSWVTEDANHAYVSAYGLTSEQLIDAARSVSFDGTDVFIDAPAGMQQIDERPRMNLYNAEFTRYSATFTNGDPTDDVTLTVVTWSDMTVYEVGPAASVYVNGVPALVVTTGGPETGITSWQQIPGTNDAIVDLEPNQPPPSAYMTWTDGGLTFTLTGPDAPTVTAVAQQLRPA